MNPTHQLPNLILIVLLFQPLRWTFSYLEVSSAAWLGVLQPLNNFYANATLPNGCITETGEASDGITFDSQLDPNRLDPGNVNWLGALYDLNITTDDSDRCGCLTVGALFSNYGNDPSNDGITIALLCYQQ